MTRLTGSLGALALVVAALAASPPAYADDDHRPPKIINISPDQGGLRVEWGPDTFFAGAVAGEAVAMRFGAHDEGHWADNGATTTHTIPAEHVRVYAGGAPRVTVCYLWAGHPSACASSDPIPIGQAGEPYKPGTGLLRDVPAPRGLRVVAYGGWRATLQWTNASTYKKVLFRYDPPGAQWDLNGGATTATTGVLTPGRTYVFKVKGAWTGGVFSTRYSPWTELRWTVPSSPPFWPGGTESKPYGPDTCKQGFVWRDAYQGDRVCVPPATRDQAHRDNDLAAYRRAGSGPYGPDTCKQGFVWRGAVLSDHVCVTPATRDQTRRDNDLAASRRA